MIFVLERDCNLGNILQESVFVHKLKTTVSLGHAKTYFWLLMPLSMVLFAIARLEPVTLVMSPGKHPESLHHQNNYKLMGKKGL